MSYFPQSDSVFTYCKTPLRMQYIMIGCTCYKNANHFLKTYIKHELENFTSQFMLICFKEWLAFLYYVHPIIMHCTLEWSPSMHKNENVS